MGASPFCAKVYYLRPPFFVRDTTEGRRFIQPFVPLRERRGGHPIPRPRKAISCRGGTPPLLCRQHRAALCYPEGRFEGACSKHLCRRTPPLVRERPNEKSSCEFWCGTGSFRARSPLWASPCLYRVTREAMRLSHPVPLLWPLRFTRVPPQRYVIELHLPFQRSLDVPVRIRWTSRS